MPPYYLPGAPEVRIHDEVQSIYAAARLGAVLTGLLTPVSDQVTFDCVMIGNPGNSADATKEVAISGIGSVAGEYRATKHEAG